MECVYDDLENYEQENIIHELKIENKELKCKLEEYASTLDALQKEFDKLSAEYKKLEMNYSSLLKTARGEIERKTKIISNLNIEKDQLVIKAMQNRGRVHTNHQNKTPNSVKTQNSDKHQQPKGVCPETGNNEKSILSKTDKAWNTARNNCGTSTIDKSTPSSGTSFKVGSGSKEKELQPKTSNYDKIYSKETKQNCSRGSVDDKSKINVMKISNRRKSMPVLNRDDIKFSSDEEQDDNPRGRFERDRFERDRFERDRFERNRFEGDRFERDRFRRKPSTWGLNDEKRDDRREWIGQRVPDITRVDDKFANYNDSSRSRYNENDRYRIKDNRERYDSSQRSKRHYSPSRPRYNKRKESSNERPHTSDSVSHRILESPPPDKYDQYRRSRDIDRQRFQNEESMKHKIYDEMEEPVCKRMRTVSLNRQSTENTNLQYDKDIGLYAAGAQPAQFSYLSLQSPDYVHIENNPSVHQIKEIKGTAVTHLDDPRLKSKKYILQKSNDKVALSTVAGRDVDIKYVDKTIWSNCKDIHKMPTPLREKPEISEDLVKDIYSDIDHPMLNLSLESGEIKCSEDDLGIVNVNINKENIELAHTALVNTNINNRVALHTDGDNEGVANVDVNNASEANTSLTNTGVTKKCVANITVRNLGVPNTSITNTSISNTGLVNTCNVTQASSKIHVNKIVDNKIANAMEINDKSDNNLKSPSLFKKYTIPKINKCGANKSLENIISNRNDKKDQGHKDKGSKIKDQSAEKEFDNRTPLKLFSSVREFCDNKTKEQLDELRNSKYSPVKHIISARDTVEGDLELSDETSDYTELTESVRNNKEKKKLSEAYTKQTEVWSEAHIKEPVNDNAHKEAKDENKTDGINKQREDSKHRIEIMSDKHTDMPFALAEVQSHKSGTCTKNKSEDIKNKLCDLFGDSSSLITPDDLGIVEPPKTNEIKNDYIQLFDNTQDAIDLNVNEMEMVQTKSFKAEFGKAQDKNELEDTKRDKKQKTKNSKGNIESKKKSKNNNEKKSATEPLIKNDNITVFRKEPNIVKTVIISTGIQNNYDSEVLMPDKKQEYQSLDIPGKVNDNASNCESIISLKALATSTPHKIPQSEPVSVPEIIHSKKDSIAPKKIGGNISNITDNATQNNLDVPDVRIIIKRRRKAKATPS